MASASSSDPAAAPAEAAVPFVERSPEELAKLSKDERKAYHQARVAAQKAEAGDEGGAPGPGAAGSGKPQLTKAQRRELQEAQRKVKEDAKVKPGEFEELLKDLKLQGLTEDAAREVIKEMQSGEVPEEDDDDDEDDVIEDLTTSVRKWMNEQAEVTGEDSLRDFTLKVRFQGHSDTLPPDHLHSLIEVLVADTALADIDLSLPQLQPGAVAKQAIPAFQKWAPMLEVVYAKIGDVMEAADVVVKSIFDGVRGRANGIEASEAAVNAAAVGCFMAIRDIDMIEDDDLLLGCKRVEQRSLVLDKFVEHLEQEVQGDSDEDSEDE